MKSLTRLLRYALDYKLNAGLNVMFNLLSTIFSLFSITMIIPFLDLIFLQSNQEYLSKIQQGEPEFSYSIDYLVDSFNYYLSLELLDGNDGKVQALIFLCATIVGMVFLKNLFRYLALYIIAPMRNGIMQELRNKTYSKIVTLAPSFFSEERKGDIISRISGDAQEIEWTVLQSLEMLFRDPISILVFIGGMVYLSPQLTIFVFIFLPISGFIVGRIGRSLKTTSGEGQQRIGELISRVEETLTGIKVIQAFNAEEEAKKHFFKKNEAYKNLMVKMYRRRDSASPISEVLSVFVLVIIIWFGGNQVLNGDDFSASNFIGYIALFTQVISPAKSITTAYFNIQKGAASEERIMKILNAEQTIKNKPSTIKIKEFKSSIEIKNVWFKYQETDVLKDISIDIQKGKTIALVGPSGGGKSTIADLVPRFYDPYKGEIKIDGIPVTDLDLKELRSLFGIVTQDSLLFNDTIHNNIALGNPRASREEVQAAAVIANAHDFIIATENGYETNIGDAGNKLSGGQKQRLSIARAILKNPPVLILDEATSALDTESEKLVQQALSKLMENRTSLVIAHRLSTIQNADEIIVLEKGKIIERGNHESLLEKDSTYKKLTELQTFK